MLPAISGDGAMLTPQVVVEYLEAPMSTDLLCKFPDNSAFDFDYSQSSIWSPLLPPPPDYGRRHLDISRKLSYDEVGLLENTKKIAARIKTKFTDTLLHNVSRCTNMKRKKRPSFGFSPINSSSSPSPKVWAKLMKAAANKFNKSKKNKNKKKKKDSNYLPQS